MIKRINSIKFVCNGHLEIDEVIKEQIIEEWNKIKKEHSFLHENQILIVTNFINKDDNYTIELKETSFSNYMYAKKNGDIRALFSGAYILTSDQYMVCVLNHYYENELKFEMLNLVGGMADAVDIVDNEYQSDKCLKREMKEELGFDLDDENWHIQLKYLKYPSQLESPVNYAIGTIYEIKTSYTKEQLIKMFNENRHDFEVKELIFFSKDNYKEIYNYEQKKQYMPELFELIYNYNKGTNENE